jgi:hypothetical protein
MVMENGVRKAEKPQTCQCMKRGAKSTYERREYYECVARATGNKNLCSDRNQRVWLASYEVLKFGPFCLGTNIFFCIQGCFCRCPIDNEQGISKVLRFSKPVFGLDEFCLTCAWWGPRRIAISGKSEKHVSKRFKHDFHTIRCR